MPLFGKYVWQLSLLHQSFVDSFVEALVVAHPDVAGFANRLVIKLFGTPRIFVATVINNSDHVGVKLGVSAVVVAALNRNGNFLIVIGFEIHPDYFGILVAHNGIKLAKKEKK